VEGLAERDAEQEDQERDPDTDPPSRQLFSPPTAAALAALNRAERRHGE
jgi:hypothetical protein